MRNGQCLACKSRHNFPLYHWDDMPLSVLGLPRSAEEARHMPRFVMDVRRCANCGHVFHTEFDYSRIPYRTGSNLVFNRARFWLEYQERLATEWIQSLELYGKRVLEIGCGEGVFLKPFIAAGNECIAFEPGPDAEKAQALGIRTYQEYFQASRLIDVRPDVIICRHVIEHLDDPMHFIQDIALKCQELGMRPILLAEVPQIDKALEQRRINDFLYEHVSNFTQHSFRVLLELSGFEVYAVDSRYNDEVVTAVARPRESELPCAIRTESADFRASVERQVDQVNDVVDGWLEAERRVALWGGTGKGAAMINMFGLTRDRLPVVVDSDPLKVGGYVPGTGQRIEGPEYLQQHPVDTILICTQWRARDIEHEIRHRHQCDAELFVYFREQIVPLTSDLEL